MRRTDAEPTNRGSRRYGANAERLDGTVASDTSLARPEITAGAHVHAYRAEGPTIRAANAGAPERWYEQSSPASVTASCAGPSRWQSTMPDRSWDRPHRHSQIVPPTGRPIETTRTARTAKRRHFIVRVEYSIRERAHH